MDINKIIRRLETGSTAIVPSMPFSVLQLREFAKAAQRGRTYLTIVAEENLSDKDLDNIIAESPSWVTIDYTHVKF